MDTMECESPNTDIFSEIDMFIPEVEETIKNPDKDNLPEEAKAVKNSDIPTLWSLEFRIAKLEATVNKLNRLSFLLPGIFTREGRTMLNYQDCGQNPDSEINFGISEFASVIICDKDGTGMMKRSSTTSARNDDPVIWGTTAEGARARANMSGFGAYDSTWQLGAGGIFQQQLLLDVVPLKKSVEDNTSKDKDDEK